LAGFPIAYTEFIHRIQDGEVVLRHTEFKVFPVQRTHKVVRFREERDGNSRMGFPSGERQKVKAIFSMIISLREERLRGII